MSRRKISRNNSTMSVDKFKYPKLHQDFELGESLGQGGFGQIFKAKHKCDKNEYAIKIIRFDSNMEDAGKNRREASNLSNLSHNHIVRYYNSWIETARIPLSEYNEMMQSDSEDISKLSENGYISTEYNDTDNDEENENNLMDVDCDSVVTFQSADDTKEVQYLCIQMELCEKNTLREIIDDNLYLEEDRLNKYFREICEGLSHIHNNGIVHRDLKPENIFLTSGDVIKIGDFGLSKQIALVNEFENLTSTSLVDDLPYSSLTDICGTSIYIAPEFYDGRNLFNNKADIYSLGVIYFEMCSRPMTEMEKYLQFPMTSQKLKNMNFPKKTWKKRDLIKSMLLPNYNERPSCEDILKMFASEKSQGEIKEMMQQTKKVPYQQIKAYNKVLEGNGIEKCDLMSLFTKIAIEIFELHGGHNIAIPTFLPSFNCDNLTTLLNVQGNYVSVSNQSRIGFSHYVQANHLEALRRYSVGKFFKEGYFLPTEGQECIFEVVSPKPDPVSDAEILYMAKEMCNKVNKDENNEIYVNINHRLIYSATLKDSTISNDDANLFTDIMIKLSKQIPTDVEWWNLISGLKPELRNLTTKWQPFNISQAKAEFTAKLKSKSKALATAFNELRTIVKNAEKFGIDPKYISLVPLLITDKYCSGFMFQVYLKNSLTVVATGDRFDSLINRSMKSKKEHPKRLSSIGISFHVDNMLGLLRRSNRLKCLVDVAIHTQENYKQKAIPLLMKLLAESIKCQIINEIPKADSSNKPPKIVIRLFTENLCSAYVVEESNMASNQPWSFNQIYYGNGAADEKFINLIKEHIAKSKTSQMSIPLPLTL